MDQVRAEVTTLTEAERTQISKTGFRDPVFFLKFFLSHMFPSDIPWFHRGIIAIITRRTDFLLKYGELDLIVQHFVYKEDQSRIDSPEYPIFHVRYDENGVAIAIDLDITRYTQCIVPRGYSKTTLVGIGIMLWLVYYQECKFPLYVSETKEHAETQLQNVKDEIEYNERFLLVFGRIHPENSSKLKWTNKFFQTVTGICCAARGRGGQIRGMNVKSQRPDCVLFDDLEDEESVSTIEQRTKAVAWFYKALKPVLPKLDPKARMIGLGTLLHPQCLLMTLAKDPEWTTIRFGAIDRNGNPLWALMMSLSDIEREKRSYAMVGQLAAFYMEYLSMIRDDDSAKFKERYIIRKPVPIDIIAKAIVIDPAISEQLGADGSSIAVVGMTAGGILPILDFWWQVGATPREQIDKYFDMALQWDCNQHGVESIAYQAALIHLMREEMFRRGRYFEITPITHGQKKDERILGVLQPRYAAGYVIHTKVFPELETQLLEYPKGKKDGPDAVAMAITLLDPYAASAADPSKNLADDSYPPLEELFGGEWRSHT